MTGLALWVGPLFDAQVPMFREEKQIKEGGMGAKLPKIAMDMMMIRMIIQTRATIHISMINDWVGAKCQSFSGVVFICCFCSLTSQELFLLERQLQTSSLSSMGLIHILASIGNTYCITAELETCSLEFKNNQKVQSEEVLGGFLCFVSKCAMA